MERRPGWRLLPRVAERLHDPRFLKPPPLRNRVHTPRPSQHRRHGLGQDRSQRMPLPPRLARIRHLLQGFDQTAPEFLPIPASTLAHALDNRKTLAQTCSGWSNTEKRSWKSTVGVTGNCRSQSAFGRIAGMRALPSAELPNAKLQWLGEQSRAARLRSPQPVLWGAAFGASLGLLLVRLSFTTGGPTAFSGPAASGLAATLGALLGPTGAAARARWPARRACSDRRAIGLGALSLLILYPTVGPPAILAGASFGSARRVSRLAKRSASVAGFSARSLILAGGVGLTPLILYWPRLARQVVPGDSG